MKTYSYLLLAFILLGFSHPAKTQTLVKLAAEQQLTIHSNILKREQTLIIRLPANYQQITSPCPVVYYFDAHDRTLRNTLASTIDRMIWTHDLPDVITVGIPHKDRTADLNVELKDSTANLFFEFITKELIQYIDSAYRTADMRVFIGHSLGGQFLCNSLTRRPDLFNGVIVISPAINSSATDKSYPDKTGKRLAAFVKGSLRRPMHFYAGSGDAGFQDELFIKGSVRLDSLMKTSRMPGMKWKFNRFNGFNHGTSPLLAIPDGLAFVFEDWHFTDAQVMKVLVDDKADALTTLKDKRAQIKAAYGVNIPIPASLVEVFANHAFSKGQFPQAIELALENIKTAPQAPSSYAMAADIYAKQKKNQEAINYYKIAISKLTIEEQKEKEKYEDKISLLNTVAASK